MVVISLVVSSKLLVKRLLLLRTVAASDCLPSLLLEAILFKKMKPLAWAEEMLLLPAQASFIHDGNYFELL
jgi:hypothetical protein